jgi:GNAT superfamily N-acetyltransferase
VTLRFETLAGAAAAPHLPSLAVLRLEVFRAWPYLYAGSLAYEERYLAGYAADPASVIVAAWSDADGGALVGAATAMPLVAHADEVIAPLTRAGLDPARVYYLGESVLRAGHRGQGAGDAFFAARLAAARRHGFGIAAFCAVERPADHPRRPPAHVPLDRLWRRHGFVRRPDIVGELAWRDLDDPEGVERAKPMVFWLAELA